MTYILLIWIVPALLAATVACWAHSRHIPVTRDDVKVALAGSLLWPAVLLIAIWFILVIAFGKHKD